MRDTGLRFVNFLLHFAVVLCLALACRAQSASNIPNTISIQASGAPSGACGNNFVYTNSATSDFYNCVAGAWNKVTSAGGGSGTVTSIATTGPIGGGTITTTGTITCTTCTTATTPTNHGVILGAGSQALGVTAAGTTGQVLTGVTGADPVWGTAASGALVQIETHTASTSASLPFTTCISGTYHQYLIVWNELIPATNGVTTNFNVSTNGGSSYDTGANYRWAGARQSDFPGNAATGNAGDSKIPMEVGGVSANTATQGGMSGSMLLVNPGSAHWTKLTFNSVTWDGTNVVNSVAGGAYASTTPVNAFEFIASSGNLTSGTVTCYGITP